MTLKLGWNTKNGMFFFCSWGVMLQHLSQHVADLGRHVADLGQHVAASRCFKLLASPLGGELLCFGRDTLASPLGGGHGIIKKINFALRAAARSVPIFTITMLGATHFAHFLPTRTLRLAKSLAQTC